MTRLAMLALLAILGLSAVALPRLARADVAFLPARAAPVLLVMDAVALTPGRAAALAAFGYEADPTMDAGCAVTEAAVLDGRLRLAGVVVAVVGDADADGLRAALARLGATVDLDEPLASPAGASDALLEPVRSLLVHDGAPPGLRALVARLPAP